MSKMRMDFVTNSSSSCFVVQTGETPEQVKVELEKLVTFFNEWNNTDEFSYENIFEEPTIYNFNGRDRYSWSYENASNDGKTIIMSADENSIPWAFNELIEEKFETTRNHLG